MQERFPPGGPLPVPFLSAIAASHLPEVVGISGSEVSLFLTLCPVSSELLSSVGVLASTLLVEGLPRALRILVFLCALREEHSGLAEDSERPWPAVLRAPLWAGSALQPLACRGWVSGRRERQAGGSVLGVQSAHVRAALGVQSAHARAALLSRAPLRRSRSPFPVSPAPRSFSLVELVSGNAVVLPRASDLRCSDPLCHFSLECHRLLLSPGQKWGDRPVV